jgi:hypothetical protein
MTKLSNDQVNSREYWKIMKSIMGTKAKPGIGTLNVNGEQLVSPKDKASVFNEYFASQSTLDEEPTVLPAFHYMTPLRLDHVRTSPEEIQRLIQTLDSSKANGPDEISIRLLQMTGQTICYPLCKLFNNSFFQGKVPSQWKQANVTPVYKKGERQIISNYRPISLLSVVGKLQERIVYKYFMNFSAKKTLDLAQFSI